MIVRQLAATDYLALKAATRALIKRCGGSVAAAAVTRVGQQAISEYGNAGPDHEARFIPIDIVADLEGEVGPVLTTELARLSGHVLVRLPDVARSGLPLGRVTGEAMKEVSDVFGKLGQFLEDGVISKVEGAQLDAEVDEAIIKLLALRAQIDAVAGKGERK